MTQNPYTIGDLIDLSIALENATEALYRGMQASFFREPEVAQFWQSYADEEAGHARWLEKLKDRVSDKLANRLDHPHLVDAARNLLKVTPQEYLNQINNLDEGYRLAVEIENSETNAIFEFLILNYSLTAQAANFLQAQLHTHVKRLIEHFPVKYRNPIKRLSVRAGG